MKAPATGKELPSAVDLAQALITLAERESDVRCVPDPEHPGQAITLYFDIYSWSIHGDAAEIAERLIELAEG